MVKSSSGQNRFSLSPLQQGMLFHALAAPSSGVDIEQITLHFDEALDVAVFMQAWELVIAQHPILHTRFEWEGLAEPQQIVLDSAEISLQQIDLQSLPTTEQKARLATHKKQDRHQPFVLDAAPLMRLAIFQLAEAEFSVLWTFHHLLLDGRSFPIVLQQLFTVYDVLRSENAAPDLPNTGLYRDYIDWRAQTDFTISKPFWEQQLAGFTAKTAIDFGSQAVGDEAHWGEREVLLSAENTTALTTFAQSQNVTIHTLLQAAWSILLHHYSSEDDIVFASTRACRHWGEGAADMVGLFINTVPMRVKVADEQSLSDYLHKLRQQQIDLRAHEHTALSDIQRWSEIGAGEALFDSLVVYDNLTLHDRMQALGSQYGSRSFAYHGQTNFPLTILGYGGEQLMLRIEHQFARFSAEIAQNILDQLRAVLLNLPSHAAAHPLDIPYFSERDRQQLFTEWNRPIADTPAWTMHDKISQQAKRTPNKVAVLTPASANFRRKGRTLTYQELDAESTDLSRHLRQLGATQGTLVGVCLQRTADMMVALLAVLKAGAAYVPIDPTFPRERINHMLDDSQAPVVITDRRTYGRLPENRANLRILEIDNLESLTLSFYRPVVVKPESLAYVIYTSGSTGKPKGVEVPHRALSNFLASMRKAPGMTPEDVLLAVTTISFDIAALEIFLPLLAGGTVLLVSAEVAADGHQLATILDNEPITAMQATPATWRMLIDAGWQGKPHLKILCGGEPLPRGLADELLERGSSLWNMYGPTETTIWSTISQITASDPITIGHPIDNTTCFVLDKRQQPLPVGVIGELVIGGHGVANGYRGRPELTAEKFLRQGDKETRRENTLPLSLSPNLSVYRTGDQARFNPDGTIECLGRIDHQVKIRGFRIELGEIETALMQHEAVAQACVVARVKDNGSKHLVAYVIAQDEMPAVSGLRKFCKTKLPDYMIPAAFVEMDAFPLTNNGKINRLALPEPDGSRPELEQPFVAPRNEVEQHMARIWRDVLLVDRVGIHDSFFDLGGDSLLVVRAIGMMRQQFGSSLGVHRLYEYRTVGELAGWLDSAESSQSTPTRKLNGNIDDRASKRRAALKRRRNY